MKEVKNFNFDNFLTNFFLFFFFFFFFFFFYGKIIVDKIILP